MALRYDPPPMSLVRTYDADTASPSVLRHALTIHRYPALVWQHRYMVQNFFRRELMTRVNGSLLGVGWLLLQPLFLFAVYYTVFGFLFGGRSADGAASVGFALYLFSGVIAWQAFAEATTAAGALIVDNGNLVKKVAFPSEVLPIPTTLVSISTWLVGVAVVWVSWAVCALCGIEVATMQLSWNMLMLPIVILIQFAMILGIGLFLANLYVFVRDIRHIYGIVTMVWMFLSPVFWAPATVIEKLGQETADLIFACNPAYSLVMSQCMVLGATDATI
jgi:lipopolysaccharide transport system permease protein